MQKKYKIDQRGQDVSFGQAFKDSWYGIFTFEGYTTRKGFWFGIIGLAIPIALLDIFVMPMLFLESDIMVASLYLSMGSLVYLVIQVSLSLALQARRLRDVGFNNQGITIYLIGRCLFYLSPTVSIVLTLVDFYVACQPSGRFLTDEKNHLFFSNREEEQQDHWTPQQPFNQVVGTVADENTGDFFEPVNPIPFEQPEDKEVFIDKLAVDISPSNPSGEEDAQSDCQTLVVESSSMGKKEKSIPDFLVLILLILFPIVMAYGVSKLQTGIYGFGQILQSKTIDVSTYDMVLYSDGESGNGTAEVEITSIPYYEGYDEEIEQLLWNPTVTLSKENHLSNGDVVTVRIELDQDELERLGLDATGIYEQDVTISKLAEPYVAYSTQESSTSQPSVLSNAIITNISATSYLSEPQHHLEHLPKNVIDGDRTTAWVENVSGQGIQESITLTLDGIYNISQMSIYSGYQLSDDIYYKNSRPARIRLTFSDNSYQELDINDQMGEQLIELPQSVNTSSVTVTILKTYFGNKYEDTAISDIRFIGQKSQGSAAPSSPTSSLVSQGEWPLSKQNELAQYMVQFGNEMKQPNYQRIAVTKPVIWSGRELDENFKILDGYEYWYDNYSKVHRYIFVVNVTGEPVVLYSKDTGDPEFYRVGLTQNEMLPGAFREIYY
ncbi:TPA: DUF805 domain-containing protein [Streptococcus suis]